MLLKTKYCFLEQKSFVQNAAIMKHITGCDRQEVVTNQLPDFLSVQNAAIRGENTINFCVGRIKK